ncbi:hypothetical protein BDZ91DRAFT_752429 [Kalaharituber pfeilii]|nr:hypothetical protein BDZ91DRAFT_752429 [Kalaharituber pfeilii]
MQFYFTALLTVSAAFFGASVNAHAVFIRATGSNGGSGTGLAVRQDIPRTGTTPNPFQRDTTIFTLGQPQGCGRTIAGGVTHVKNAINAVIQQSGVNNIVKAKANGFVQIIVHQVNADGAGPFNCRLDQTGTGTKFVGLNMNMISRQVPGTGGLAPGNALKRHILQVKLPANLRCTGTDFSGAANLCLLRCQNPAPNGPFGGCVVFQQLDRPARRSLSLTSFDYDLESEEEASSIIELDELTAAEDEQIVESI